jgi:hypothetical protein
MKVKPIHGLHVASIALIANCGGGPTSADGPGESLTTRSDGLVVHCSRSAGEAALQVFDASATLRMDLHLSLASEASGSSQFVTAYNYYGQDQTTSDEIRVAGDGVPACAAASTYALSLVAQAQKGLLSGEGVKRHDSWGCDSFGFSIDSCSNEGSCCDGHDACYFKNGCQAKPAWAHTLACSAAAVGAGVVLDKRTGVAVDAVTGAVITALECYNACDLCNAAAVGCILFERPGQSACCDASPTHTGGCNVCGSPRLPGVPFGGCVVTCQCGPDQTCDVLTGQCHDGGGGAAGGGGVCSPILLDLSGNGFRLTSAQDGVLFDISGAHRPVQLAWTSADADDAFLALDRNGNGNIDDGKELFGNFTDQPQSTHRNGFAALATFDDGNGIIDARDAVYRQLRLWIDKNHDGKSQPEELVALPAAGVYGLSLRYRLSHRVDQFGNVFRYRARVNPVDGNGPDDDSKVGPLAYDVFLKTLLDGEGASAPAR